MKRGKKKKINAADLWLINRLKEAHAKSGMSRRAWLHSMGIKDEASEITFTLMWKKPRAVTFHNAVRWATAAGIELSELQAQLC